MHVVPQNPFLPLDEKPAALLLQAQAATTGAQAMRASTTIVMMQHG